ncbi:MAG: wax ester/triacylglycerol synthase family O-acyltransferase [Deltaproteobacteria bacterium]|nr:wax ester/triacylglycerol synthase family O-acyltransferase [Deltaproteobacteria bacterium]MBW2359672.1 wax ester/triacylglycerol synthase family O-acyltransferase [Deltaproteobacteria bacterium]
MQQLGGLDATFLNLETGSAPLHIGNLAIYDQSSAPNAHVTFKGILQNLESRLHLARCFRQRLVEVPFGLDHPYWIEDSDFDLEFHVRHIALPKPGDWRQLCIQAARIHARPLDLAKPLWEMYVIEGLDGVEGLPEGSFSILTKIHHAAIDGVSGIEIAAAIHDLDPAAVPAPAQEEWVPESAPSWLELAARTTLNSVRQPLRFAQALGDVAPPALRKLFVSPPASEEPAEGGVPRTRFNDKVTPHRVVEGRAFSLAQVKAIRKQVPGATVNDVVLAVVSGALRHYLDAHGELPRESLKAFAPISVRTEAEKGTGGNQVSGMFVALHTEIEDPLERLAAIHKATRSSKETSNAIGARSLTDVTQFLPGALAGAAGRLVASTSLMHVLNPVANCVVTNIPGPQVPLYMTQARLVANYGLGLPLDGLGLFHVVLSYAGTLTVTLTACRKQLPDPAFYAECLERSFAVLRQAAGVA